MEYKLVKISDSVQVRVPLGLAPDEEKSYIADRIAFVDLESLENECVELVKLWEAGELISLESALNDAEKEANTDGSHT